MTVSRLIARPMLASIFVVGGVNALRNASTLGTAATPLTDRLVPLLKKAAPSVPVPEDPTTLVRINAATQLVAAFGLATGRAPRLSAAVLAASVIPSTAAEHRFWEQSDPDAKKEHRQHFFKNVSLVGGLIIAAGDTDGKPGVAWRARHAAKDARRQAGHLTSSARREAKLAKAQLT